MILTVILIVVSELAFDWGGWWDREMIFPNAVRPGHWWRLGPHEAGGLGLQFIRLAGEYLLGLLVLFVAPRLIKRTADPLEAAGWPLLRYLVIGLLIGVVIAGVALASAFSMHTFVMPFLLVGLFFLVGAAGMVGLTYALGHSLIRWGGWSAASPLVSLGVGTLLVYALRQIPFLGPVVLVCAWSIGVGSIMATRFGSGRPWSLAPLTEESET
jgi:hypothetical protein